MKASVFLRSSYRRHPLARIGLALLAIALLGIASLFALAIAAGVLGVWLVRRTLQRLRGATPATAGTPRDVLDGEFRVVSNEPQRLASR